MPGGRCSNPASPGMARRYRHRSIPALVGVDRWSTRSCMACRPAAGTTTAGHGPALPTSLDPRFGRCRPWSTRSCMACRPAAGTTNAGHGPALPTSLDPRSGVWWVSTVGRHALAWHAGQRPALPTPGMARRYRHRSIPVLVGVDRWSTRSCGACRPEADTINAGHGPALPTSLDPRSGGCRPLVDTLLHGMPASGRHYQRGAWPGATDIAQPLRW